MSTSSSLGHSVNTADQQSKAPAQGFGGAGPGNTSALAGASNPSTGGSAKREDGLAQSVAGTLPNDFTLKGMKAEYKGEDKTQPNALNSVEGEPLSTAGAGGDTVHKKSLASHEFDLPAIELGSKGPIHSVGGGGDKSVIGRSAQTEKGQ